MAIIDGFDQPPLAPLSREKGSKKRDQPNPSKTSPNASSSLMTDLMR